MTPDFRIGFPPTRMDFTSLGVNSGLDIDNYPAPGSQARYDWQRSVILGLLANQASFYEPTQFKIGSQWFDLSTMSLKIRGLDGWEPYAAAIPLTVPDSEGNVILLSDWYASVSVLLNGLAPEIVFSGRCTADGVTSIGVPVSLQNQLFSDSRVFLYIGGLLVDPALCSLIGSPLSTIRLSTISLSAGDTFIVQIKRIGSTFYTSTVVVP